MARHHPLREPLLTITEMKTVPGQRNAVAETVIPVSGILALGDDHAFLRVAGYRPSPGDVYVPLPLVRKYGLRAGDEIQGTARPIRSHGKEKHPPLIGVETVNGAAPTHSRPEFQKLTPLFPQERLNLGTSRIGRVIDLISPVGKGQRGLIVAPPKAGKTIILQALAHAITTFNPECHLMVVLIDERPEEVTDLRRSIAPSPRSEVISSTFDRPADEHIAVTELALERAKRLVEAGHDVVMLLDSITRLGRAHNLAAASSSRILAGGVAASAIYPPKKFFGAARNLEEGGSLTILATALVETGSRMDDVFFEEFKGTGNMELKLDRHLADKRIFPAVDVNASSTRRDDLLLVPEELELTAKLRRVLHALTDQQAIELLIDKVEKTGSNAEFLLQVRAG